MGTWTLWDYLAKQLVDFSFFFCRICLGRRCLHNLVGFLFFYSFFPSALQWRLPVRSITYLTRYPVGCKRQDDKRKNKTKEGTTFNTPSREWYHWIENDVFLERMSEDLIQTSRRKLLPKIIEKAPVTYVFILFDLFPTPAVVSVKRMHGIMSFWVLVLVSCVVCHELFPGYFQPRLITASNHSTSTAVLNTYNWICTIAYLALFVSISTWVDSA